MTQAQDFETFMAKVWDAPCTPAPDGGVFVGWSPLYDKWHDAISTARARGAHKLYSSTITGEGNDAYTFEFADGSRVNISHDGSALCLVKRHHARIQI